MCGRVGGWERGGGWGWGANSLKNRREKKKRLHSSFGYGWRSHFESSRSELSSCSNDDDFNYNSVTPNPIAHSLGVCRNCSCLISHSFALK